MCSMFPHGEGVAVEQAWSVLTHGEPGKPLKGKLKIPCAVGIADPVRKIRKRGLFGLSWAVWLDNKVLRRVKESKIVGMEKDII